MLTLQSAEQMVACGRDVASLAQAGDVLILDGPLGAGKTTFTRGLGEGLNVRGPIDVYKRQILAGIVLRLTTFASAVDMGGLYRI